VKNAIAGANFGGVLGEFLGIEFRDLEMGIVPKAGMWPQSGMKPRMFSKASTCFDMLVPDT
jgi:hypothetical protein